MKKLLFYTCKQHILKEKPIGIDATFIHYFSLALVSAVLNCITTLKSGMFETIKQGK